MNRRLIASTCILAALMSVAGISRAQTIGSLERQDFTNTASTPPPFVRLYLYALHDGLRAGCGSSPLRFPDEAGVLRYPMSSSGGTGGSVAGIGRNLQLRAYIEAHDGAAEIKALIGAKGCKPAVHAAWIAGATKYLNDPVLGANLDGTIASLCDGHGITRPACDCVARNFSDEMPPRSRRAAFGGADSWSTFQEYLLQDQATARIRADCGGLLKEFSTVQTPVQERRLSSAPYSGEWSYRTEKGLYRYEFRCTFSQATDTAVHASCLVDNHRAKMESDGRLADGVLTMDWLVTEADIPAYQVHDSYKPSWTARIPKQLRLNSNGTLAYAFPEGSTERFTLAPQP